MLRFILSLIFRGQAVEPETADLNNFFCGFYSTPNFPS